MNISTQTLLNCIPWYKTDTALPGGSYWRITAHVKLVSGFALDQFYLGSYTPITASMQGGILYLTTLHIINNTLYFYEAYAHQVILMKSCSNAGASLLAFQYSVNK